MEQGSESVRNEDRHCCSCLFQIKLSESEFDEMIMFVLAEQVEEFLGMLDMGEMIMFEQLVSVLYAQNLAKNSRKRGKLFNGTPSISARKLNF